MCVRVCVCGRCRYYVAQHEGFDPDAPFVASVGHVVAALTSLGLASLDRPAGQTDGACAPFHQSSAASVACLHAVCFFARTDARLYVSGPPSAEGEGEYVHARL